MKRRLPSALSSILLLGVALAISALLAEASVRLLLGEQVKFPRHVVGAPWGLRFNEPLAAYRHKSPDVTVWFRINQEGMRADRAYGYEKPAGVKRIVSLGDSFTIGYEVNAEDTFSSVLERELGAKGLSVEVLNCGVSGYSTAEEYLYLERELWKYHPDLVLVSYFPNDLVDNTRSGLFGLQGGRLSAAADAYVPAGGLGDFLNTNPVFNWLSAYSDAFAFVKERATSLAKRRMVEENLQNVDASGSVEHRATAEESYQQALAVALFEALYETTRAHGVPLVIQSIPEETRNDLADLFPDFDVNRPGVHFLSAKQVLEPYRGKELLYWKRSHFHWTPFSHRVSGKALAELIVENRLL
jgi:hypothetical protein